MQKSDHDFTRLFRLRGINFTLTYSAPYRWLSAPVSSARCAYHFATGRASHNHFQIGSSPLHSQSRFQDDSILQDSGFEGLWSHFSCVIRKRHLSPSSFCFFRTNSSASSRSFCVKALHPKKSISSTSLGIPSFF